ncbi:hypothetical protein SSX86_030229 [Deinandra increscens subsp. villosa]|uniref:non-specific serine/threonine protein kinase n=1 Tax=Deinandra increscens subsp. villosa TaxID=3103831 RepID=A0AAP0GJF2_9ASTR
MESFTDKLAHLKIPLNDIKSATNNFDDTKVIGHGGFGRVYRGEILSHFKGCSSSVAIKRVNRNYGVSKTDFLKMIEMLTRYKHEGLISLLGFCDEGDEKILVYEYASNGSLDRSLSSPDLTWVQRLKICIAAARGLSYLHGDMGTKERIIHRDVKSSNILLDENCNAKIADFGLSKLRPANQPQMELFPSFAGTLGYSDPLYYYDTHILSTDVYSFGVLLFEVICGKLSFDHSNGKSQILVPTWKESFRRNKLQDIIFDELKQQMGQTSLEIFMTIAYECLHTSREERPTMSHVVKELESALECQERYEGMKLTKGHKQMLMITEEDLSDYRFQNELTKDYKEMHMITAENPLKTELETRLLKGILLNRGKTVEHEVLIDDSVDLLPVLDTETYWELKLPSDYEDIIKRSKDSLQWETKKDLYAILCKGFPISYGEEWFFLANDGKKCLMLPARAVLEEDRWEWKPKPETRFEEVAGCIFDTFAIISKFNSKMLSPQTTYAAYLAYNLPDDYKSVDQPPHVQVVDKDSDSKEAYNIFLCTPQTPHINWNEKEEKTTNPSSRRKIKGLPKRRSDGWMEVQVHEFQTRATTRMISTRLKLSSYDMSLKGVIVQGLEFRPV